MNTNTIHRYNLRDSELNLFIPTPNTEALKKSFPYRGAITWNSVPLKNHPRDVAKKYVETYSSSNAAAQYPEERAQLIKLQYLLNRKLTNRKEVKQKTDQPRMT